MTIHELPTPPRTDEYEGDHLESLFVAWRRAEVRHHALTDADDPRAPEAQEQFYETLGAFTRADATTAQGLLKKLKAAFDYSDLTDDAIDQSCLLVAPRLLVSVLKDVERWAIEERYRALDASLND